MKVCTVRLNCGVHSQTLRRADEQGTGGMVRKIEQQRQRGDHAQGRSARRVASQGGGTDAQPVCRLLPTDTRSVEARREANERETGGGHTHHGCSPPARRNLSRVIARTAASKSMP